MGIKVFLRVAVRGIFMCNYTGDSANAVPHYQKLRTRVTHIWGNRRGQPNRSAMEGPHPGGTAFLITVSPVPGKYAFSFTDSGYKLSVFANMWCVKLKHK